ncbi:polysaccharide lyase [Rosistilla ulvae]|nr:polysaccharide lyase [Rosistilla ulvae]
MSDSLIEIASVDVSSRDCLQRIDDADTQYLGLRLFPGQPKLHGGIRSEVSVDYPFRPGDRIRYRWRFKIPHDFQTDAPENRWWVIGQWHDQPNPAEGQTWANFPTHSPPVSLTLGELDGQIMIGLSYGCTDDSGEQQVIGPAPITRGQWHTIESQIDWSQDSTGRIQVYLDGVVEPIFSAAGPNMNNGYQHYLKFGMYRHPEIASDNWIYVDDLEIQKLN